MADSRSSYSSDDSDLGADAASVPASEMPSELDVANPKELKYRAKIFLQNLRSYLQKKAHELRQNRGVRDPTGKLTMTKAERLREQQNLTMTTLQLLTATARDILSKTFIKYARRNGKEATQGLVEMGEFSEVVKSFSFPGAPPLRGETVQFLFDLCATGRPQPRSRDRQVANPAILLDLVFGASSEVAPHSFVNKMNGGDPSATGASKPKAERRDQGFASSMDDGRNVVGVGPITIPDPVDRPPAGQVGDESYVISGTVFPIESQLGVHPPARN
jgi:hypothetical protein